MTVRFQNNTDYEKALLPCYRSSQPTNLNVHKLAVMSINQFARNKSHCYQFINKLSTHKFTSDAKYRMINISSIWKLSFFSLSQLMGSEQKKNAFKTKFNERVDDVQNIHFSIKSFTSKHLSLHLISLIFLQTKIANTRSTHK